MAIRLGRRKETKMDVTALISSALVIFGLTTLSVSPAAVAQPTNLGASGRPASASLRTVVDQPPKSGVLEAGWSMALGGQSYSNEKEQAQTAGLELGGRLRYGLLPNLELKSEAGLSLQSGYAQSRFGDNTPKNGIDLREALIQYKPLSRVTLQAGAINQAHLNSPLLVSAQAFPAVLEQVVLGSKDFNVEFKAQQAVPTSSTLSTQSIEAESTPNFMTEGVQVRGQISERLLVSVYGFHYAFHNLPTTVATASELYGNTVTPLTANRDRFTYEFDGISYGSSLKLKLSRTLQWLLDAQILNNLKAPDSYGQGQLASTGFEIGLASDVDLKPKGEIFFAESDVAPGFYNGSDRGHNNRTGWAADLSATFKKAGFLVGARFVNADTINQTLLQTHQTFVMLRFETLYALF